MKFKLGDYVRIAVDYHDRTLQGQTGNIAILPNEEHPYAYCVRLNGGRTRDPFLNGRLVWVSPDWLKIANRI